MKYLQPTFQLPVSDKVTQEEWDRIFESEANHYEESNKDWFAENNDGA